MEQEGKWLAGVLTRFGARNILDASAGTGRQAIPLCRQGFYVTAADPSRPMLQRAEQGAQHYGLDMPVTNASFVELPLRVDRTFDAVIAFGNSLCNLTSAEAIRDALRAMRCCLVSGGVCLIGIKDF